ncbi:MAG: response regulator [Spirulina sp. SIO3F2]|nr:response regulator [Spirulina sp. SIO3F2]
MEAQAHKLTADPILVVDDNPNNLKVLSQALRSEGWKVSIAKNGEIALKQVQHTPPSLILLDVMMPEMDGFETCQALKANPKTMDIPIIFMTALAETVDKVKGLSLGAVDYITKPFQMEEVLARLNIHYKVRTLTHQLELQNQQLDQKVKSRTEELEVSLQELQKTQLQLVQNEKMATLGQMLSGIAHEINNPLGFIDGNVNILQEYLETLFQALRLYQEEYPDSTVEFKQKTEELGLEFLFEDIPELFESMEAGIQRIRTLSTSLRVFSRSDTVTKVGFNIHEGIDSTLVILKYKLKGNDQRPAIEVSKVYGQIPSIHCFPGQLNQVFMNIIANAIDALDEQSRKYSFQEIQQNPNRIIIQTELDQKGERVMIRIADNGTGMTEDIKQKIFDAAFTTKAVGKGTGLGLSIAHQIITEAHKGTLTCTSEAGQGTEFTLGLPLS